MNNDMLINAKKKFTSITIIGVEYKLPCYLSWKYGIKYLQQLETTNDSKYALASIIYEQINHDQDEVVSLNDIFKEDEISYSNYISTLIHSSKELE